MIPCLTADLIRKGVVYHCINAKITFIERNDLNVFNEYIESVFVVIDKSKLNVEKLVIIWVIYRPPNTDIEIFNEYLGNILDKVGHEEKTCYISWVIII